MPSSFRVVLVRFGMLTGRATFPSRPSHGTTSAFASRVVSAGIGSSTPLGPSFQVPPAGVMNGLIQCSSTPARMRAIVLGARPSGFFFVFFLEPIGVPRSVQSIVYAAGRRGGSMSWPWHAASGHTHTYWPFLMP
ncbi:hypothetical protein ACFQ0B_65390 [Nonomuraea thailandensis]